MFRQVVLLAFCVRAAAGFCDDAAPASWVMDERRQAESAAADGRWLDARNAWTKVLAWDTVAPSLSPEVRSDVERRRAEADAKWRATQPPPAPSPSMESNDGGKKERHRASRRRTDDSVDTGATAKEIMSRARAARDAGQLESALRLYRLAAERPGGESARRAAAEIAEEMGEPQVER